MTVQELQAILQAYTGDTEVRLLNNFGEYTPPCVEEGQDDETGATFVEIW